MNAPAGPGIDRSHDPARRSWVESANDEGCEFPIQNLPFGRFRDDRDNRADMGWRIGVAIGDQLLDLRKTGLVDHADMNRLMRLRPETRRELRLALSDGLAAGSAQAARWREALLPMRRVRLGLPCTIGDYTDFYVGIHHATAIGRLFRPDQPLLPNYKWVPIGYHGRASTIVPSGTDFVRPRGQVLAAGASQPALAQSARLDYELELALFIGRPNPMGRPIPIDEAEDHLFGIALFNDWSARDLQAWEYQPLGPFLSKNFASTVSPWIVTLDALAPFRRPPAPRAEGDPQPLPYLDGETNRRRGAFDIELHVLLQTAAMRAAGHAGDRIAQSNFADAAYWTPAQLVAHHTVNGCSLSMGDVLGSGTLSGSGPGTAGSLIEATRGGAEPLRLSSGEERRFLEDGDAVELRGACRRDGFRTIGFGACRGTVLPALQP